MFDYWKSVNFVTEFGYKKIITFTTLDKRCLQESLISLLHEMQNTFYNRPKITPTQTNQIKNEFRKTSYQKKFVIVASSKCVLRIITHFYGYGVTICWKTVTLVAVPVPSHCDLKRFVLMRFQSLSTAGDFSLFNYRSKIMNGF